MLFGLGMLLQDMGKPEKARLQLEEGVNVRGWAYFTPLQR